MSGPDVLRWEICHVDASDCETAIDLPAAVSEQPGRAGPQVRTSRST